MRLTSLKLQNFRGFERYETQLHPQFNLLIGENGSGKTSILEAASVAIGAWLLAFPSTDSRHIKLRDVRRVFEEVHGRSRQLPQFPVVIRAEGEISISKADSPDDDPVTLHRSWERSLNGAGGKTTQAHAASLKQLARTFSEKTLTGEPYLLPVVRYFGAGRLWESVRTTEGMRLARGGGAPARGDGAELAREELSSPFFGYRLSVDKRCNPADLISWMAAERRIEQDEDRESPALRTVYSAIRSMMPELAGARYNIRLGTLILERENGDYIRFSDLSDGYRNVIAIAADIAIRMVMLNPHLADNALLMTPGVILIDEIDLHLHPMWQRRIVDDLRRTFPKVQFICTTHSPFIVQSLRSGEELISLDSEVISNVNNLPIAEVAEGLMGVSETEYSERYVHMKDTATSYLESLQEMPIEPGQRLDDFKERLARKISPYADNPAFQAFLEMKLAAKEGADG